MRFHCKIKQVRLYSHCRYLSLLEFHNSYLQQLLEAGVRQQEFFPLAFIHKVPLSKVKAFGTYSFQKVH